MLSRTIKAKSPRQFMISTSLLHMSVNLFGHQNERVHVAPMRWRVRHFLKLRNGPFTVPLAGSSLPSQIDAVSQSIGWIMARFFEKWVALAFQWLGVARGGFLWLF